jgi:hypothetical protein
MEMTLLAIARMDEKGNQPVRVLSIVFILLFAGALTAHASSP